MNIFSKIALLVTVTILIASCSSKIEQKYKQIADLENEVFSMKTLDREKGTSLINAYVEFSEDYPQDTSSVHFLFKAGDIAMNMGMGSQAILYYDKVLVLFPDYYKAPECVFLKAFIFENQLNNLEEAEKFYKLFIEKYPNHVLAKDAEASLKYLGKSPEELMEIFQGMN